MALVRYGSRSGCTCCTEAHAVDVTKADAAWAWSVRLEREAQRKLQAAFMLFRNTIIDAASALGDVLLRPSGVASLPWDEAGADLLATWTEAIGHILLATGEHQVSVLRLPRDAFEVDNPYALRWMEDHGSELITEVVDSTRDAVRALVHDGVRDGKTMRDIAKDIRSQVGLRSDQIAAAQAYRSNLEASDLPADVVDARASRYEAQLLKQRSELISRTETGNGVTEGSRIAWKTARDRGYIGSKAKRRWNSGAAVDNKGRKRTCKFCLDFNGQTAELDGEYTSRGVYLRRPATSKGPTADAHPGCRCSESIVHVQDDQGG